MRNSRLRNAWMQLVAIVFTTLIAACLIGGVGLAVMGIINLLK